MCNLQSDNVTFPHLDRSKTTFDQWEILKNFTTHMRRVPVSRVEIKILSSIQFTADKMNSSDAHISKELVELGLRSHRISFPMEFLDYADNAFMRYDWDIGAPSDAMIELRDLWFGHKEQHSFASASASFRHVHCIIKEDVLSS